MSNRILSYLRNFSLRNFFAFFVPISIAIMLIMLYNLSVSVEHLSVSLIRESADEANLSIRSRFEPVVEIVKSIGSWEFDENSELTNVEEMNTRLIPTILQSDQISSMMIAATDGTEYMLLETEGKWNNRITQAMGDTLSSTRYLWDYKPYTPDSLISCWPQEAGYDPRTRLWFKGALTQPNPNQIYWTPPYVFFTTKEPGITASVYSYNKLGDTIITAFDILLKDVNRISQAIELTPNGMAMILTGDDLLVAGLPALEQFLHPDSVAKYILTNVNDLDVPIIPYSLMEWEENGSINEPFSFKFERNTWWAGIVPIYSEGSEEIFYSMILVPESDFLAEMNRTRLVIIGGFTLVLILTILIIRAYNQIRKTNALLAQKNIEIERQKVEIEGKNKQITDSIIYAKRIQTAILPPENKISTILPDCFVLYLPKDIVSGDFYWLEERDDIKLFAAVDCTGHGVPGAFVSIVGHDGLNRTIREYKLKETDRILNRLNQIITEILQHSIQEEVKDGMDMALCALNAKIGILQYSGARNPLYLIRANNNKLLVDGNPIDPVMEYNSLFLFEVKADRMGIEPKTELPAFTHHDIGVEKNDLVYLFTDGFADQFGGPKEKKFTYKRFKEKLLSNATLSMNEQKQDLLSTLGQWKGDIEQVDDILVMGVRIT